MNKQMEDYQHDIKRLESEAMAGDAKAQYEYGQYLCYERVAVDEEVLDWWMKSAEQGYAEAQYEIATCHFNGHFGTVDDEKGFEWAMKAALQNNEKALMCVASCYEDGCGVKANKAKAAKWHKKAIAACSIMMKSYFKYVTPRELHYQEKFIYLDSYDEACDIAEKSVIITIAEPGAMGCEGTIRMMDAEGNVYSINYLEHRGLEYSVFDDFPSCTEYDLGNGNHLYVIDSLNEDFETCASTCTEEGELYEQWIPMTRFILKYNVISKKKETPKISVFLHNFSNTIRLIQKKIRNLFRNF